MPIQEEFRKEAQDKLKKLGEVLRERLRESLQDIDPEDLEFGVSFELTCDQCQELWKEAVEENVYMEVSYTEIMEHHDGAYLKSIFKNSTDGLWAERYVNIRSSGRVEISHALFLEEEGTLLRVERQPNGTFKVFAKSL
ncbi:hypothetical protein [Thermocrinis minervae]|uniref:Uncharacterized protein n=1 Tax=Thermocrinis minervae TaxID=381751 RepID=A0A1M6SE59_9AQUI|nr:hypothetical protein [Thermocrinis minervae]SHK43052.1 hypothetical protein SAMN05444391_0999 [Thermocrinis minervae]